MAEGGLPVTPDTLFRIASTTKLLVGTAILRLVESGTLDLDAPVSAYLPWFHFSQPGMEDQITLRHLLSHTSGLCTFRMDHMSRDRPCAGTMAHHDSTARRSFIGKRAE